MIRRILLLLILGLLCIIISAILETDREFSWRRSFRDIFIILGSILMFEFWVVTFDESKKLEVEEPEPITLTLTTSTPEIVINDILEKEFDILTIDTLNDTTYRLEIYANRKTSNRYR